MGDIVYGIWNARKSHTTITRHQEDKLSKATSPLKINYAGLFDFIFHIKLDKK